MSRLTKTISVNNKNITVQELSVRDIKEIWKDLTTPPEVDDSGIIAPLFTNQEFLMTNWKRCVQGMDLTEIDDLTPSELQEIYDAFKEVNQIFFDLALKVEGENPFIKGLRLAVQTDILNWIHRSAPSLQQVIEESGITDTASSLQP